MWSVPVRNKRSRSSDLPFASALAVFSATDVAELRAALAGHMVTALGFFHPKFAFVALLETHASDKLEKLTVVLVNLLLNLVVFTGHAIVVDALAIEAVVLVARWANEFIHSFLVEHESELAVWCWAPGDVTLLL